MKEGVKNVWTVPTQSVYKLKPITMKIKVKYQTEVSPLLVSEKGEWVDLRTAQAIGFQAPQIENAKDKKVYFDSRLISFGIAVKLPKYFEANILPRSSTFKNTGILMTNGMGIVDSTYCGNNDIWAFPAMATQEVTIPQGTRIAQFRIRPSQFAPWWVKLKWLFTSKIEFVRVYDLESKDRGGFGSTGV